MNKKVVMCLSDWEFDNTGDPTTGYSNIASSYCNELRRDFDIIGMGISYRRNQYNIPIHIINVPMGQIPTAVMSIFLGMKKEINKIMFFLDIPMINRILTAMKKPPELKVMGIFAVEGDPLIFDWAKDLIQLDKRYVISEFGTEECKKQYVSAKHAIVPINTDLWKRRTVDEQKSIKETMGLANKQVFFINADSNERKNISTQMEGFRDALNYNPNLHLVLLTRKDSPVGWNYNELVARLKLTNNCTVLNRGISQNELWKLYAASDFLLNTSKAEGLGLPILEAMAIGVPVIATNATAMSELLSNGRGILIDPFYTMIDVFGNTNRYLVHPDAITKTIVENIDKDNNGIIDNAYKYILHRNNQFLGVVDDMKEWLNE